MTDTRTKEQIKADRNERARLRMAKHRETQAYQDWLIASRERRRLLKEKYRRQAGVVSRTEKAKASEEKKRALEVERQTKLDAANQPDSHVRMWVANCRQLIRDQVKKEIRVSVERLRELLEYENSTGLLRWRVGYGKAVKSSIAGVQGSNGYVVLGLDGEKFRAHRVAWAIVNGVWPSETIDHIDGNRGNNRMDNLRCVAQSVNMQNMRKPTARNSSGYLGVYWSERRGGWMAALSLQGKKKRWGPYKSSESAYKTYIARKRQYHEGCTL